MEALDDNLPDDARPGLAPAGYMARVVEDELLTALEASPAVLLEGPRACGKTWTGRRCSASEALLDAAAAARLAANFDPAAILEGATPRLIDEWQIAPNIWNPMRRACDDRGTPGQFILTGSASPPDDITRHSGAGRVLRVRMRTMRRSATSPTRRSQQQHSGSTAKQYWPSWPTPARSSKLWPCGTCESTRKQPKATSSTTETATAWRLMQSCGSRMDAG